MVLQNAFGVRPALVGIPGFVSVVDLWGCGDETLDAHTAVRSAKHLGTRLLVAGVATSPCRRCELGCLLIFSPQYRCSARCTGHAKLAVAGCLSSRLSILIVTSTPSGLTVFPHQRAYSQTEERAG